MSDFKNTKAYSKAMQIRDWQTCDLIAEEHEELVKEILSLKSQLKKEKRVNEVLEEVRGFYGCYKSNWTMKKAEMHEYTVIDESDVELIETSLTGDTYFGGRRARQAKTIIEKIRSEG